MKCVKIVYFFIEMFVIQKCLCCNCQLVCENTKNVLLGFLCYQKCHVEWASMQGKNITSQIKKGHFKYYCDNCKKFSFWLQNVDNLDYDYFYNCGKLNVPKIKDKCYLNVNSVTLDKENIISVVYMNIRSLNANLYKIEEFLSIVQKLPDVIWVCET